MGAHWTGSSSRGLSRSAGQITLLGAHQIVNVETPAQRNGARISRGLGHLLDVFLVSDRRPWLADQCTGDASICVD